VWLVIGIFVVGAAVGVFVADRRSPSYALDSELIYRLEIGAVVAGALLFVLTTIRLASYGRTYTSFGAGPVTTAAGDPASAVNAAVLDVEEIGVKVDGLAAEAADLAARVAALEAHRPE
jgi:hypothetical protein